MAKLICSLDPIVLEYSTLYYGSMKTTVDIPDKELDDAMRYTRARSKREAIVTAIADFNRRRRMAELSRHAHSCESLLSSAELKRLRDAD